MGEENLKTVYREQQPGCRTWGTVCLALCQALLHTALHLILSALWAWLVSPCTHSADEGVGRGSEGGSHCAETLAPHVLRCVWGSLHQQPLLEIEHLQQVPALTTKVLGHFGQGAQHFPELHSLFWEQKGYPKRALGPSQSPAPASLPDKEAQGTRVKRGCRVRLLVFR